MNTRYIDIRAIEDTHAGTVDALVSYLVDCRFTESHLTAGNLVLALEYVYQPRPRFWRDLSIAFVVDSVARCFPTWPKTVSAADGGSTRLLQDIEEFLLINAFDESNAEKLLTLPKHLRPSDPALAFTWLCTYFVKEELWAELEFAERDGNRCGAEALELVYLLEQVDREDILDRPGTLVARAYRDSVMKRHAGLGETVRVP